MLEVYKFDTKDVRPTQECYCICNAPAEFVIYTRDCYDGEFETYWCKQCKDELVSKLIKADYK